MINSDTLLDQVADDIIVSYCIEDLQKGFSRLVYQNLKDVIENTTPHKEFFEVLFKSLVPHEKRFASMLKGIWEDERRIVIANIKKLRKAYRGKDAEDEVQQLLFPQREIEARVAKSTEPLLVNVMSETGQTELARLEIDVAFDVDSPEVRKWLKKYVPVFSENLAMVDSNKLRRELIKGLEAGDSIPELMKRVNDTYAGWSRQRSYDIAQNQVIRASNRGANFSYIQSGVVHKKEWLTHHDERTCDFCADLDGRPVDVEENFFDEGDTFTIGSGEKKQTMKLDYEDIGTPPLHNRCRCAIIPVVE